MKFNSILSIVNILWILYLSGITAEDTGHSFNLKSSTFDFSISKGIWFIKHYAPWCPHCKRLAPIWKKLSDEFHPESEKNHFNFGEVNCDNEAELCNLHQVTGYPTLLLYKDGALVEEYNGDAESESPLREFIKKKIEELNKTEVENTVKESKNNSSSKPSTAPTDISNTNSENPETNSDVNKPTESNKPSTSSSSPTSDNEGSETSKADKELEKLEIKYSPSIVSSTFSALTSKGYTFVKFYAPWCPHCQHLRPIWLDTAKKMEAYNKKHKVKFAQFDCDKERDFCMDAHVMGFPTLMMYKDGTKIATYTGFERTVESIKKWVEDVVAGKLKDEDEDEDENKNNEGNTVNQKQIKNIKIEGSIELNDLNSSIKSGSWFVALFPPKENVDENSLEKGWSILSSEFHLFDEKYNSHLSHVLCSKNMKLCKKNLVTKVPIIKLYHNGDWVEDFIDTHDRPLETIMEDLRKFIREGTFGLSSGRKFARYWYPDQRIPNPDGTIMELQKSGYDMIATTDDILINFYIPNCSNCKKTKAILQDLAKSYLKQVNIAMVNCETDKELCNELGIKNYPTLRFLKDKVSRDYHGPIEENSLEQFLKSGMRPSIYKIDNQQYDSLLNASGDFIVYVYENVHELDILRQSLKGLYLDRNIYIIELSQAASTYLSHTTSLNNIIDGRVVTSVNSTEMLTKEAMIKQLQGMSFSRIQQLDISNFDLFMGRHNFVIMGFFDPEKNSTQKDKFQSLDIKDIGDGIGIGWLNGIKNKEYLERVYNKKTTDLPFVVLLNPSSNRIYNTSSIPLTPSSTIEQIQAAIKAAKENKLPFHVNNNDGSNSVQLMDKVEVSHFSILSFFAILLVVGVLIWLLKRNRRHSMVEGNDIPQAERRKMLEED